MTRTRIAVVLLVTLAFGASAIASLQFTPAKHRKPPNLTNYGWKAKPLRIIAFVPSDYPRASKLAKLPQAIVHSKWLKRLEQAYLIPTNLPASGRGFVVGDMPKLPKKDTNATADFDAWLTSKLKQKGLGAHPAYQTIFILFNRCVSPQSVDTFGCVSHHPTVGSGPLFTSLDSYALVLSNPTANDDSTQDALTATATHELAEAATDTGPKGWRLTSADKDRPWGALIPNPADSQKGYFGTTSPFVEDEGSGNIESADMLAGSRWFETYNSTRYEYVRIYSRYGNDHRDDPGVPPTPHPFYNVQPKSDWYGVAPGKSKTVTVTGWSTKSLPRWNVTADVHAWEGSSSRNGATKVPAYCALAKSSFKVGNRDTLKLKVTAKASAKKNTWCVVRLVSQPVKASANGDTNHRWYVGFIIS